MKAFLILLSIGYALGRISLGLLLHPYQTMQSLFKERVFIWLTLLPTQILALITIGWRLILVPAVREFFSCQASGLFLCGWLTFLSNLITFFCVFWQLMLLYLLVRFTKAHRQ